MISFSSLTDKNKKNTNKSRRNLFPLLLLLLLLHHLLCRLFLVGLMNFVRYEATIRVVIFFYFWKVACILVMTYRSSYILHTYNTVQPVQLVQRFQKRRTLFKNHYISEEQIFQNISAYDSVFKKRRTLLKITYVSKYTIHELFMNCTKKILVQSMYGSCMVQVQFKYSSCIVHVQFKYSQF